MPQASEVHVGESHELVLVEDLTRTRIVQYAGASGDYNPLHTDEVFAKEVAGFPTVFAHGMLTMGLTGRVVTDWFGAGNLRRYGVRFVGQVWPGDTLTATATIDEINEEGGNHVAEISVTTLNQRGETVLTGTASARLG